MIFKKIFLPLLLFGLVSVLPIDAMKNPAKAKKISESTLGQIITNGVPIASLAIGLGAGAYVAHKVPGSILAAAGTTILVTTVCNIAGAIATFPILVNIANRPYA